MSVLAGMRVVCEVAADEGVVPSRVGPADPDAVFTATACLVARAHRCSARRGAASSEVEETPGRVQARRAAVALHSAVDQVGPGRQRAECHVTDERYITLGAASCAVQATTIIRHRVTWLDLAVGLARRCQAARVRADSVVQREPSPVYR